MARLAVSLLAAPLVACSASALSTPAGTDIGASRVAEQAMLEAVPLTDRYGLPSLPDGATDEAARLARDTQVFRRAQVLGVDADTAFETWATASQTASSNRDILPSLMEESLPEVDFSGATLSELDAFVDASGPAYITVTSRTLRADAALTIEGDDVVLDFDGAALDGGTRSPAWMIEVRDAHDVAVINAEITGGRNGILVVDSSHVALSANNIHDLTENGIVITGESSTVHVSANRLHKLDRAGIMLHGKVTTTLIDQNEITELQGHSNWNAGILLTGRRGDIAADPDAFFLPDGHWVVEEPIYRRLTNPERNVILDNDIRDGLSSGIYNDGTVANLFLSNRIEGNAKEGVCFDNGATANVFAGNVVKDNGKRWGQPDDVLAFESVLDDGRADDGTAVAKLPGISIDNAIYNQIYANDISGNWGGGIKMVRTSLYNTIVDNSLTDNGLGRSSQAHFFGIELGAARADFPATDLDFVGSSGNILVDNNIHGEHYSGVFIAQGSVQNAILDNDIDGVEALEIERPG